MAPHTHRSPSAVPMPGRPDMLAGSEPAADADELLDRLKKAVFRSRARVADLFRDFDPLRTGFCAQSKFCTALTMLNAIPLNETEMQALAARYAGTHGRVDYRAMLAELESVFTTSGMERDPASTTSDFTSSLRRPENQMPPHMEHACDELIQRLARTVMVRGLEVRRPFVDYFRSVNSPRVVDQVTKDQFVGGLTQLGLDASGVEVALLAARFAGEPGFVNFNSFACAVDPALNTFSAREPRSDLMEGAVFQSGFRAPTVLGLGPGQPGRPPTGSDFPRLPREASSSEVEGLIRRMQDKALQYRVRVGEALKDFDKHHDGTVTQPQFAQALWQTFGPLHLSLTEAERAMLVDKYATLMGHGAVHVNWRAFVKDVEAVFTGDGPQLERSPTGKPAQRYLEHPPVSLEAADEAAVQALLRDIKRRVEVRRALVKPMFADYEKQVNSAKAVDHVTRSQMVQALSRLGIDLPVEHQRLLHARYDTHANGLVNYVALVRDIDPLEAFSNRKNTHHVFPQDADFGRVSNGAPPGGFFKSKVSSGSPQPGRPAPRNEGVTGHLDLGGLEAVLSRLADAAKANRLKTDLAFKEFDMASRNQLTTPQFVRVVDMLFGKFVTLSQDDTASLVAAFATPLKGGGVGVAWKDFVAAVDGMPPPAKGVRLPSLSPTEESLAAECCARLRHVAYTRRLLIRPFFTDMEKARRAMNHVDHVTRSQFAECLSSLGLQCSAAELEALNRKFDDKADGWVNFVAFQVAIDPEQAVLLARDGRGNPDDTRRYAETGGWRTTNTVVAGQPGRPPVVAEFARLNLTKPSAGSLDELLARLRSRCATYQIGLGDFFYDFDRHNLGLVSPAQLRQGLNSALGAAYIKADLSSAEVSALERAFSKTTNDGVQGVDYRSLVRAVSGVPNLEYDPSSVPPQPRDETPPLRQLGEAEEAALRVLLKVLRERFATRQIYVKAPFTDFAKSTNSPMVVAHVTRDQFVKALARHDVMLSFEQVALLTRKFDDLDDGTVNYEAFCEAVESYKSASGVHLHGGFKQKRYTLD